MLSNIKTMLILNPAAGKGGGKQWFVKTRSALEERVREVKFEISDHPGHLYNIARNAVKNGFQRLIVIGGDGSCHEVLNGILDEAPEGADIELGLLPSGTGNSLLRDFTEISYEKILVSIIEGKHRLVDVGKFSYFEGASQVNKYYLNILGVGLIADILKLTNERLKFLGSFGYSLAVMLRLFKGINNKINLTVDGVKHRLQNSALVISNSKYTGGKMKMAPMASTNDGKVDIIVFNEVGRMDILNIFSKIFKGEHVNHKKVKLFSGSEIEIDSDPQLLLMADGELLGKTPLKLKVLAGKQKVLI